MATKEAAAVANNYGVSIEQLTALITMATARTRQSGSETGNAVRSLMLNLNDITNKQIVKAFDYVGVSMYKMVEGSKQLKTPIELLGELSEVFNSLPKGDDKRAYILSEIGGKYRSNTLAAILQDWKDMEGIMQTYASGAGSAMEEAQKTVNTLASSLTNLRTSGQEFFSKFFDTDTATDFLKVLTNITQFLTDIVDKLGAIPTILATISATALIKNGGRTEKFVLTICRHLYSSCAIA